MGRGVVRYAKEYGIAFFSECRNAIAIPGLGMKGDVLVDGRWTEVVVGRKILMTQIGADFDADVKRISLELSRQARCLSLGRHGARHHPLGTLSVTCDSDRGIVEQTTLSRRFYLEIHVPLSMKLNAASRSLCIRRVNAERKSSKNT